MSEEEEEEGGGDEGTPAWMATFADLMSLLLTFFILILSFANMDVIKFSAAVESLQEAFGNSVGVHELDGSPAFTPIELSASSLPRIISLEAPDADDSLASLRQQVEMLVQRFNLENMVEVDSGSGGVIVRVVGQLLFDPGSVDIRPESFAVLNEIAALVKAVPEAVSIEGHTDDSPVSTPGLSSNWHLSTGRAISVLHYFSQVQGIDPKRMSVSGYASTRPLEPNDSPEHRESNRRVEFIFRSPVGETPAQTASR